MSRPPPPDLPPDELSQLLGDIERQMARIEGLEAVYQQLERVRDQIRAAITNLRSARDALCHRLGCSQSDLDRLLIARGAGLGQPPWRPGQPPSPSNPPPTEDTQP